MSWPLGVSAAFVLTLGFVTGATHVLLPSLPPTDDVYGLLSVFLPIISSTLVVLDVSNCLLESLPDSLARCHVLEELNISENPLMVLPGWLGQLSNLRVLVVDACGLRQLPIELAHVRNLHTLCGEWHIVNAVQQPG